MDPNFQEKLSHINDLIKLSMIDGDESHMELNFINSVAARLGIEKEDVKKIKDGMIDITFSPPRSESKVIEQFHRVIILIGIDKLIYKEEVSFCVELGVRMGLNYGAINEVLKKTLRNPAHIMQFDEMKEIFNKYSN
jgi:hypothetical protein